MFNFADGSFKSYQNDGHIVAAEPFACVSGQEVVEEILSNFLKVVAYLEVISYHADKALAIFYIFLPDPIATDDNELIVCASGYLFDVGLAGDHLLSVVTFRVLLIVEVSE